MEKRAKDRLPDLNRVGQTKSKQVLSFYHDCMLRVFENHASRQSDYLEKSFLAAARTGDSQKLRSVLERLDLNKVDFNFKEKNTENTPLMVAAEFGHEEVVSIFLSCGSDVTLRNAAGRTVFDIAPERIKRLVLDAVNRQGAGQSLLWQASWQGNATVVKKLLNLNPNLKINSKNSECLTPLLLVTRDLDLFDRIEQQVFSENYNPTEVVAQLLHQNADCGVVDSEGHGALHLTARSCGTNAKNIISLLARKDSFDVNVRDNQDYSALHFASDTGNSSIMLTLIDNGADINARGQLGRTPLHITASRGDAKSSGLLVDHGANVLLVDDLGFTPVDVAKGENVRILLKVAWTEHVERSTDSLRIKSASNILPMVKLEHLEIQDVTNNDVEQQLTKTSKKSLKKLRDRSRSEEQHSSRQSSDLPKRSRSHSSSAANRSRLDPVHDLSSSQPERISLLPSKSSVGRSKDLPPDINMRRNRPSEVCRTAAKVTVLNIDLSGSKFQKHMSKSCSELPFARFRVQKLSSERSSVEIQEQPMDVAFSLQGRSLSAISLSSYDTLPRITSEESIGTDSTDDRVSALLPNTEIVVTPATDINDLPGQIVGDQNPHKGENDFLHQTFNFKEKPVFWFPLVNDNADSKDTKQMPNRAFFVDFNDLEFPISKCAKCGGSTNPGESKYSHDALCFSCHQEFVERNCFWVSFDEKDSDVGKEKARNKPGFVDWTVEIDKKTVTAFQGHVAPEVNAVEGNDTKNVKDEGDLSKRKQALVKSYSDVVPTHKSLHQKFETVVIRRESDSYMSNGECVVDTSEKILVSTIDENSKGEMNYGCYLENSKNSDRSAVLTKIFRAWRSSVSAEFEEQQGYQEQQETQRCEEQGEQQEYDEKRELREYEEQCEHQECEEQRGQQGDDKQREQQRYEGQRKQQACEKLQEGEEQHEYDKQPEHEEAGRYEHQTELQRCGEVLEQPSFTRSALSTEHCSREVDENGLVKTKLSAIVNAQQDKKLAVDSAGDLQECRKDVFGKIGYFDHRVKNIADEHLSKYGSECQERNLVSSGITGDRTGLVRDHEDLIEPSSVATEPLNDLLVSRRSKITPHEVVIVNPYPTPEPPKVPMVSITSNCKCDRFVVFANNSGSGVKLKRKCKTKKYAAINQKSVVKGGKKGSMKKDDAFKSEQNQSKTSSGLTKRKNKGKCTESLPVKEISVIQTHLKGDLSYHEPEKLEILASDGHNSTENDLTSGTSLTVSRAVSVKREVTVLCPISESSRLATTVVESDTVETPLKSKGTYDVTSTNKERLGVPRLLEIALEAVQLATGDNTEKSGPITMGKACDNANGKGRMKKVQIPFPSRVCEKVSEDSFSLVDSELFGAHSVDKELDDIIQEILEGTDEIGENHGKLVRGSTQTVADTNFDHTNTKSSVFSRIDTHVVSTSGDHTTCNPMSDARETARGNFSIQIATTESANVSTRSSTPKTLSTISSKHAIISTDSQEHSNAKNNSELPTPTSLNNTNAGTGKFGQDRQPIRTCSQATFDNISLWLVGNYRHSSESSCDNTICTQDIDSSYVSSSPTPRKIMLDVSSDYSTLSDDTWDEKFTRDDGVIENKLELNQHSLLGRPSIIRSSGHWLSSSVTISMAGSSSVSGKALLTVEEDGIGEQFMGNGALMYSRLSRRKSLCSATPSSEMTGSEEEEIIWKKGNMLGKGAFGTVWCGLTNAGQMIAVKQVELITSNMEEAEQQYEKLQEEVALLKSLRHENVVSYLGTCLDGGVVNIFMQFVPGGSIASILARFGPLDESVFQYYTKQIILGVAYLHRNNVVHRDIKGGNIMLMPTGVIKLIDFGCAKRLYMNMSHSQGDLLRSMKGTPYWMAPEVITETGYGRKSDIWSIGCTVYEMATGKPPWSHLPPMSAILAIGQGSEPPALTKPNSEDACHFVMCSLTRHPDARWSAEQLLQHPFIRTVLNNVAE